MQIIGGLASGIQLSTPKDMSVRPTGVRARKALFDILRNFSGLCVADLFAGSGALGLEAASRGAKQVLFVERDRQNCRNIEENISRVTRAGIECECRVICGDATDFNPPQNFSPDLIFADPPYADSAKNFASITQSSRFASWTSAARLIWEVPEGKNSELPPPGGAWRSEQKRSFGGTSFLFLIQSSKGT